MNLSRRDFIKKLSVITGALIAAPKAVFSAVSNPGKWYYEWSFTSEELLTNNFIAPELFAREAAEALAKAIDMEIMKDYRALPEPDSTVTIRTP